MLSQIKVYLVAGLGIITALFYALFQREKAGRADDKAKTAEKSRQVQKKASDQMVDGLTKEQKVANEKVDPTQPRDHFS